MSTPGGSGAAARERAARRRRLAQVFGDGLPDQTSDSLDEQASRAEEARRTEEWLRRQVPPHHSETEE